MGQTSNPLDHCRLANLLPVEEGFYLMGEVVPVKGISSDTDS